jgi:hypothetical protein
MIAIVALWPICSKAVTFWNNAKYQLSRILKYCRFEVSLVCGLKINMNILALIGNPFRESQGCRSAFNYFEVQKAKRLLLDQKHVNTLSKQV